MTRYHLPKGLSISKHCCWKVMDTDNYLPTDFVRVCDDEDVYHCIMTIQAEEIVNGLPVCTCGCDPCEDNLLVSGCGGDSWYGIIQPLV